MYNAHWIHSLPYSKFIELTLFKIQHIQRHTNNMGPQQVYQRYHLLLYRRKRDGNRHDPVHPARQIPAGFKKK